MQCALLGKSGERKIKTSDMSRHTVLPWRWQKQIPPKYYYLSVKLYSSNLPENTNPGWLTPVILCTCEVHSVRSAGVCVCVCLWYWSVCIVRYVSTRWGGQGEPLTMRKYYSTLVWMITHAHLLHIIAMIVVQNIRLVSYDLIWSLMKQGFVVTHKYRVLQGTERAWQTNLSMLHNSNII